MPLLQVNVPEDRDERVDCEDDTDDDEDVELLLIQRDAVQGALPIVAVQTRDSAVVQCAEVAIDSAIFGSAYI